MNRGNFKHSLEEILFVAVSAAISGIVDWDEMEVFGRFQFEWFCKYYPYKNGIPSHDTINRLFSKLCPQEFGTYFMEWTQSIRKPFDKEVISIDGKTVKGSAKKSKHINGLHFISAFACENELVLGQLLVDSKSNEITAVPKLLDLIDCKGSIITVDALNTQIEIAQKVIDKNADYIFALKGNQGEIHEQIIGRFKNQSIDSESVTEDIGHGRVETRKCSVITDLRFIDNANNWPSIKSIIKIDAERYIKATGVTEKEIRYYISSLSTDAELINKSVRSHWAIENKLHWMLDVSFKEDQSRKRKNNATENYSMICKIALNMIKSTSKNRKCSYKIQKLSALLNNAERERIMGLF